MGGLQKPTRKKCGRCKMLKPLSEYPPCKAGRQGVYNYCRECHAKYQMERHPDRQQLDEKSVRRDGLKRQGLKTCSSCKEVRSVERDFYADPRHADGKQSICKDCWREKTDSARLKKEYGLTREEFIQLLDAQDGLCAICGRAPKHNKFNVDHCHKTHRIRALLCVNCNTNLLPYVERFPEWVRKAFEYLKNPPGFAILGEKLVPETNQSRRRQAEQLSEKEEEENYVNF